MGKRQKQADLEENLMGLAYLDFVGLNKAKEKEPDGGRDRPYDGQDPWAFKPEVSPTHMNF